MQRCYFTFLMLLLITNDLWAQHFIYSGIKIENVSFTEKTLAKIKAKCISDWGLVSIRAPLLFVTLPMMSLSLNLENE